MNRDEEDNHPIHGNGTWRLPVKPTTDLAGDRPPLTEWVVGAPELTDAEAAVPEIVFKQIAAAKTFQAVIDTLSLYQHQTILCNSETYSVNELLYLIVSYGNADPSAEADWLNKIPDVILIVGKSKLRKRLMRLKEKEVEIRLGILGRLLEKGGPNESMGKRILDFIQSRQFHHSLVNPTPQPELTVAAALSLSPDHCYNAHSLSLWMKENLEGGPDLKLARDLQSVVRGYFADGLGAVVRRPDDVEEEAVLASLPESVRELVRTIFAEIKTSVEQLTDTSPLETLAIQAVARNIADTITTFSLDTIGMHAAVEFTQLLTSLKAIESIGKDAPHPNELNIMHINFGSFESAKKLIEQLKNISQAPTLTLRLLNAVSGIAPVSANPWVYVKRLYAESLPTKPEDVRVKLMSYTRLPPQLQVDPAQA